MLEKSISVEISTVDNSVRTAGETVFRSTPTNPVLYEDHPLTGISYEKALSGNFALNEAEIKLVVEPYFFSSAGRDSGTLVYDWLLNGISVPNVTRSSIVFRIPEEERGAAQVSVRLNRVGKVFQRSSVAALVDFNSPGDTQ